MKTRQILILMLLAWTLNSFSCKKKVADSLPPETQTGANTFGCMIDGQLFLGGYFAPWMTPKLTAAYETVSDKLYIEAWGKMNNNAAGVMGMTINHPIENEIQSIEKINYQPMGYPSSSCSEYITSVNQEVFITKFDTINKIVSGRFKFLAPCSKGSYQLTDATTVEITQGRFDLKLDIYNE